MKLIIKSIKYVLIILLILISFFVLLEVAAFSFKISTLIKEGCFKDKTTLESIKSIKNYYCFIYKNINNSPIDLYEIRKPIIKNNTNGSIILLGCSFTYGHLLKDNETFGAVLSDYTDKSVYNWGLNSSSPREILYLLHQKDIIKKLIEDRSNVEYVIYTYIPDHIFRLYYNLSELSPIYKLKDNSKLIYKRNTPYNVTFLSRELQRVKYKYTSEEKRQKYFSLYIKEINEEIKKNFKFKDKNTKFVILIYYPEGIKDWNKISELDNNIITVNVSDIAQTDIYDDKYRISKDDIHPNAEAWKIIVPNLIKYLDNIKN